MQVKGMIKSPRIRVEKESSKLRKHICDFFGAPAPEAVILAPGILNSLQVLFAKLGARKVVLTENEYYGNAHFPAGPVVTCAPEDLFETVVRTRPDAVLSSLVTFKGKIQPTSEQFAKIRRKFGRRSPLLVTDYTHAGAMGFPPMQTLNADIVVGDFAKWVAPPCKARCLSFLCVANSRFQKTVVETFRPFFLATGHAEPLAARWVASWEVREVLDVIASRRMTRKSLVSQSEVNYQLARQVSTILGLPAPESCIVWARKLRRDRLIRTLAEHDLVWNTGDGFRIRCREEWLREKNQHC